MRIAALYDIHGNLPALEVVLKEITSVGADRIVIGGDVVPGPMPRETLDAIRHIDIPVEFLRGNGEVAVLQQLAGQTPAAVPEAFRPIIEWTAQQLAPGDQPFLQSWPQTLRSNVQGVGEVLFCHATPRNENEIFTRLTPDDRLHEVFNNSGAAVVICGHTHMQFDRTIGGVRVVNAGSVGMPFGAPAAYWLLIGPDIQLRHTDYDLAEAAARIRGSGYPQAEQFAATNILKPPTEEQMLAVFTTAELK